MRYVILETESMSEIYEDMSLGISFLFVTIFALIRTRFYFDPFGSGRIITAFYLLIAATALIRAIWFLIPSYILEGSYVPIPILAFESDKWVGCLISEILLVIGSLLLYSQFILVISYWAYMLKKTSSPVPASSSNTRAVGNVEGSSSRNALSSYFTTMSLVITLEGVNVAFFITKILVPKK